MTKGLWIHGPSGCGKSHKAYEGFDPDTHYVLNTQDKGWWDGFTSEHTHVIIDDFRADLKFSELLRLVDKWPHKVPRRHIGPASFCATHVTITAIAPPEEIYSGIEAYEKWEQFNRRFEVICMQPRELAATPGTQPAVTQGVTEVAESNTEISATASTPGFTTGYD